ncbi:MAG: hypothetical protein J6S43_05580 [Lentisphaeria bacterium]|nr:hypothetical protein [Lentisphaeria bacterium]
MIPSDHFVRFYNEVFKFLDRNDGLEKYYLEISRHQEHHCLDLFSRKGIAGMREYWNVIAREENIISKSKKKGIVTNTKMISSDSHICPSLTKNLDNDAGVCEKYCLHCPGWVIPIFTKTGFYCVYDLINLLEPTCSMNVFAIREEAEEFKQQRIAGGADPALIYDNLDKADEIEANKIRLAPLRAQEAAKAEN